jgi:hypothetical protein
LGVGLTTPPRLKNIVTKSEEVKTGLVCQRRHRKKVALNGDEWAEILKKASGPTMGCRDNDDDDDLLQTIKLLARQNGKKYRFKIKRKLKLV